MVLQTTTEHKTTHQSSRKKTIVWTKSTILSTIIIVIMGAALYLFTEIIPMPYLIVGLVPLGIVPSYAVVATIGAVRGSIAGFLTGYLGVLLSNLAHTGNIIVLSLYGIPIGVLGLIVGNFSYDLESDQSLVKLSSISAIGLVSAALLTATIGIIIERVALLVAIAFQILPILTLGIPSVILLTPLFAKAWYLNEA